MGACLAVCLATLSVGCSFKRLVIRASYSMVEEATSSFYEEPDAVLAAQAAPANLKLIEGMARGDPANDEVQLAASQLLGMYAFGFLEDCCLDPAAQDQTNQRARLLYLRGRDYAVTVLRQHADFDAMLEMNLDDFGKALEEFDEENVPELFWAAFNWGLYINLSRTDLSAIADLSKVAAMAERVIALDESYFYGSAHLFLMVFHGSMGRAVGGSPEKARAEYEKAWAASKNKFLMTKYMFAKTYCLQTLDRELFEKLLKEILAAPADLLPEQRLSNTVAKEKAARLLSRAEDLF